MLTVETICFIHSLKTKSGINQYIAIANFPSYQMFTLHIYNKVDQHQTSYVIASPILINFVLSRMI